MATATSFVFSPEGPFSLAASIRFLEGFAPAAHDGESAANLEMAFCVDGYWDPVAVRVHEEAGAVHGTVDGGDTLAPAVIAAAVVQVERILSLDIDGRGFPDIARRDPVVARLQSRYPGLRPVCFWSPYEAAAWSVIGQRIRIVQAAAIKARITAEHGEIIDVGGRMVRAFPNPAKLAQLSSINGLARPNSSDFEVCRAERRSTRAQRVSSERQRGFDRGAAVPPPPPRDQGATRRRRGASEWRYATSTASSLALSDCLGW
jgi:DNA-3-methyladenine glycosylase II